MRLLSVIPLVAMTFLSGPAGSCQLPQKKAPGAHRTPVSGDVVVIQIAGNIAEEATDPILGGAQTKSLRKLVRTFRQARLAKDVKTIVVRIGDLGAGWAQVAELRHSMALARKAGKRVVAHLDDAGNAEYFLATAADEIVMSPTGTLLMNGVAAQAIFVKGLLAKVGVEAEFLHEGKYKGAADSLTRDTMSPEMRESLGAVLDTTHATLVAAVAKARGLPEARVKELVDGSPHAAGSLVDLKLADRVADHVDDVRRRAGSGSIVWDYGKKKLEAGSLRGLMEMLKPQAMTEPPRQPHLALVYAVGNIVYGQQRKGFGATPHVASHHLVKVLDELRDKDNVKAVVLRIDSPGGSALASDLIWQAVRRLAAAKPVVVSMGNVAASGGYYIAAPGHRIFAEPTTLTGSIGVVGGKFSLAGLFEKIGVRTEVIKRGARADLFTLARTWTPEERQVVQRMMATTYGQFVDRVATGRKLGKADVEKIAQGRIWSGKDALANKLVDELGGLQDAVEDARKRGKLPDDALTAVYPPPKSWLEKLQEGLGMTTDARAARLGSVVEELAALAGLPDLLPSLEAWRRERVLAWLPVLVRFE
jgi:protease-4